jgi:predicted nucleotide-binding protein (sugar kinase/HSP70/actin superfamily)
MSSFESENAVGAEPLTPELEAELERELAAFAEAEARRLGLSREQHTEKAHTDFRASQRPTTTIWVSGLSLAHDQLVSRALRGIGYVVDVMPEPDNEALQFGKEFGNRGQCNPTYFTVGNLVKHLVQMRDVQGLSTAEIIERHVFLTAGACGPCRFGTYVTEYRKALRDAGFEGFRVLLFQQQGGVKQATGEELGLKIDGPFAWAIVRALMCGDVINLLGYRTRPYELEPGATDRVMAESKKLVGDALEAGGSVVLAMARVRRLFAGLKVDRSVPKPKVSVIGEFWAMTTEGDGNYKLQRFLEQEGAEVDVQTVTAWILFMIWENRYDTDQRLTLKEADQARKGLAGKNPTQKLLGLAAADKLVRGLFQTYAKAAGLHGYHLPDMDEIATLARDSYGNEVRGGEGHMEVGKLIHFVQDRLNHMTVSVKPFGCMPSSGVSDGVQSLISTRFPEAIFLPIETTGDGAVNVYSRVQMMLFKARQNAKAELQRALEESGIDEATFKARLKGSRRFRSVGWAPRHRVAGTAANLAYAVGG